ncbi:MAG TPA: ABC transporter substrate-binding protein [Candidatus Lustribacter sp.]
MCLARASRVSQANPTRARALALLAGAATFVSARSASSATLAPIRVGTILSDTYAEPFYFAAAGIAQTYGITLDITTFKSNPAIGAAVAAGALDVGVADMLMIANGFNRGIPFAVLAGAGQYDPDDSNLFVCIARSSTFKTAKDFEGTAIGVPTLVSSIAFTSTKAWFAKNGADPDKLHFVEMPFATMASALQRGSVAAAVITEPFLSQLPPDLKTFADPYEAIGKHFLISEWFTMRDWTTKNRSLAKRLVRAIYDTARWANAHQEATATILAKAANLDPDHLRAMRRTAYATELDPQMLVPVLTNALRYKTIERTINTADIIAHT